MKRLVMFAALVGLVAYAAKKLKLV